MSRIARLLAFWIVPVGMVLTNCSKPALGQDDIWSMPRGNAAASGWSPHTLPDSLAVAWEFKADEAIETTPVVDAERVYFADVMGTLYAVSRESGSELWRNKYDTGFLAAPVVVDDRLVIGDIEGNVYAVSSVDGKKIWTRETEGEISGAAGITGDKALVASQDGKLYCFELADGKLAWEYQADDQIRCSPTIAGDRTFLGGCDSQLHVIDLNTGKAVGDTLPLGGPTGSTPAVLGDRAILPIMDGSVFAFDWKAKKQLWRYEDLEQSQEYRNSAAVSKEFVVISSERRQV
ncbi:MAG: PQQ-binding-like beta-propeller repeat protein, partial [Planctomycetota bacterium]